MTKQQKIIEAEAVRITSIICYNALRAVRNKAGGVFVKEIEKALNAIGKVATKAVVGFLREETQ